MGWGWGLGCHHGSNQDKMELGATSLLGWGPTFAAVLTGVFTRSRAWEKEKHRGENGAHVKSAALRSTITLEYKQWRKLGVWE